jgi:CRP/FNR family transcriptional regulator
MDLVQQAPERPTNIAVLRSNTLFNSLTAEELDLLAKESHMAYAERGETIWLHGKEVDFFGLIGVGFVKMVRSLETGQEVTTEIIGPGQIFGLLGTLEGIGCPLTARAVCNTWYLKVPKSVILPVYESNTTLKSHLLRRTTQRFRQTMDLMARMSTGKVEERIAIILVLLSQSYGDEVEKGVTLRVPLTRQDVAEMAGTTVESTIRVMSRWQKEGIIESDNRLITILDMAAINDLLRA